jgi:hypothetical protein
VWLWVQRGQQLSLGPLPRWGPVRGPTTLRPGPRSGAGWRQHAAWWVGRLSPGPLHQTGRRAPARDRTGCCCCHRRRHWSRHRRTSCWWRRAPLGPPQRAPRLGRRTGPSVRGKRWQGSWSTYGGGGERVWSVQARAPSRQPHWDALAQAKPSKATPGLGPPPHPAALALTLRH